MQGVDVTDGELMEYISESSMMSKALVEYEGAPWAEHAHARACRLLAKHQYRCHACALILTCAHACEHIMPCVIGDPTCRPQG